MSWALRSTLSPMVTLPLVLSSTGEAASGATSRRPENLRHHPTIHSSDGVRGPSLTSSRMRSRLAALRTDEVGWQGAPRATYSQWTQVEQQGPVEIYVLTARLDQPGLVLDQVSGPTVSSRAPFSQLVKDDGAVAGGNGDFFDIGDT